MSERRIPLWVAVAAAVLIGVATAVQARVNGSLGGALNDGYAAALVSFGSGLAILIVLCAVLPAGRAGTRRLMRGIRTGQVPWWVLLGGLGGALTTATQGLTVATVGVALFTVGVVAGQTLNGLVLDRVGYGPGGTVAVTMPRIAGAALALTGVVVCASAAGSTAWWMLLLPFLAGAGIAWQQGTNGILGSRIGSPVVATLVNFFGGTAALAVATGVHVLVAGPPAPPPSDPWLYVGGALGVAYIALSVAVVRTTGVLLLGLGSVVGLLLSSVLLDAVWPAPSAPPLPVALVAVAIALAGVTVAVVPWRRGGRKSA
ncbi:DMT family transporter [Microbacterium sp. RD1]|uniref:DMT family transporter n=1 Tax=Microbacterium sp. RD1 TaxID=3457313 RepID=UPI003FA5D525